jgi:hypothetical protein
MAQHRTQCYATVLPGGKSGLRAGFRPDSNRESISIGPSARSHLAQAILAQAILAKAALYFWASIASQRHGWRSSAAGSHKFDYDYFIGMAEGWKQFLSWVVLVVSLALQPQRIALVRIGALPNLEKSCSDVQHVFVTMLMTLSEAMALMGVQSLDKAFKVFFGYDGKWWSSAARARKFDCD